MREKAGLFDISHMGQIRISGTDALSALESLVPNTITSLSPNRQVYSVLTNANGGVLDDLMIMNLGHEVRLVVNAACKHDDLAHLRKHLSSLKDMELLDTSLIALQGPLAADVLKLLLPDIAEMSFMDCGMYEWRGSELIIARCGYTGEDGFEISIENDRAESFVRELLQQEPVALIGLGARDSLRLEAGLCLYGQDLTSSISPVEADLRWVISQQRIKNNAADYPGVEVISRQMNNGTERLRVGLKPQSKVPLRANTEILNKHDDVVGVITSGGFGASVNGPVAMGYINTAALNSQTAFHAVLRGKTINIEVCALPFVPHRYHR